mmetsp:Transcript_6044/g.11029  ORF Transcript_6044/g.11029 Transcript_6044/m.11029 type:complete len:206 (+) Transcript_6044:31-648(+)
MLFPPPIPPAMPFCMPPFMANMFCCVGLCCAEGLLNMDIISAVDIFFCSSSCCCGCPGCCCIWPLASPPLGLLPVAMLANRSNCGSLATGAGAAVAPPREDVTTDTEACTAVVAAADSKSPKSSRSTGGAGGGAGAGALADLTLRADPPWPPPPLRAARSSTRFRAASEGFRDPDEARRRCTPDTTFSCSALSICRDTRSKALGS